MLNRALAFVITLFYLVVTSPFLLLAKVGDLLTGQQKSSKNDD